MTYTFDSVCVDPSWCLFLSIHLMTCRHLTVFVSIHLMTCTFDNVSIHLMTYTFDSVCVDPSYDSTVMYYHWLCLSSHLMTCRHIWQMCSSHDLQMLLTVFVSFHLMTSDTFNSVCVLLSHDLRHFWQCLCPSISWPADTFDSVCVHPSHDLRHFWQCLCPSISWPADTFDSVFVHLMTCTLLTVCLHPSHDLQTLLTIFVSVLLMTCRHFWQWFYVHPSHDIQTLFKVGLTVTW